MPTDSGTTWYSWSVGASNSTTANDYIWGMWTDTSGSSGVVTAARQPTAEERAQIQTEHARRLQAKREAEKRARDLLDMFLTPEQRQSLEQQSAIVVKAESERVYRIKKGRVGNIEELDSEGKIINRLCVHPNLQVPDYDTMLTQKIWLETNEAELRRIANITPVRQ